MSDKETPKNNNLNETLTHENRKRLALKITVGVVAVILIFLWAFAARNRFVNFAKTDTTSAQMVDNVQKQWEDAVQVIDAGATDQAKAKEQVRETLTNIIIAAASSTKESANETTTTNQQ
jgi:hypothetical protein